MGNKKKESVQFCLMVITINLRQKNDVMTDRQKRPGLKVLCSLVQTVVPWLVCGVELQSLLVTHSPAVSKLIEVTSKGAIRLHILIFRLTVIVSTKAKHERLVGAWQNHLWLSRKEIVLSVLWSVFVPCCTV